MLFILTFKFKTGIPIYGQKVPKTCLETHFDFFTVLQWIKITMWNALHFQRALKIRGTKMLLKK
jgi:hypothetical protein